jgi:hypothetical protein
MAADDLSYIYDPIDTDGDFLQQEAFDYIQSRWPDWRPHESNLEAWLIAACARMVAEARDLAADVPPAIFKYYGMTVLGVTPIFASSSEVGSTWTFTTNPDGRTIEAGTLVAIPDASGETIAFEVVTDVTVPSPTLTTTPGQVVLRSVQEGAFTDGIGGTGMLVEMIDPLAWVATVSLTSATGGGSDEEDDYDYLNRLSRRLTLLTPRPVLARDAALLAEDIALNAGTPILAMGLDNFNPADGTSNNERMTTVVVRNRDTGGIVSAPLKASIDAELQAQRETNFIIHVIDPAGPHPIDVTFIAKAESGYDPADVDVRATAAVQSFLATSEWGISPAGEQRLWRNKTVVRHQDISTILNSVEGFDYWTTLTIGLNGGAQSTNDINLTGNAPLAAPGTILGTVT